MIGRRLGLAALAVALAAAVPAAASRPDFAAMQVLPYDPPKPAPAFALPDLSGKTVRLADVHAKVLWLFFWATW